jgi:hypothetical protein
MPFMVHLPRALLDPTNLAVLKQLEELTFHHHHAIRVFPATKKLVSTLAAKDASKPRRLSYSKPDLKRQAKPLWMDPLIIDSYLRRRGQCIEYPKDGDDRRLHLHRLAAPTPVHIGAEGVHVFVLWKGPQKRGRGNEWICPGGKVDMLDADVGAATAREFDEEVLGYKLADAKIGDIHYEHTVQPDRVQYSIKTNAFIQVTDDFWHTTRASGGEVGRFEKIDELKAAGLAVFSEKEAVEKDKHNKGMVRVFGRNLYSRMPLDPTHVRLKRTCV